MSESRHFSYDDLMIESGRTFVKAVVNAEHWNQPWTNKLPDGPARNPTTGTVYSGLNAIRLSAVAAEFGDERFLTRAQIAKAGLSLDRDARPVQAFRPIFAEIEKLDKDGNPILDKDGNPETEKKLRGFSTMNLYNAQQVKELKGEKPEQLPLSKDFEDHMREIRHALNDMGVELVHGGNRAYYMPTENTIRMPGREQFSNDNSYLRTLLHEMAHATGHPNALNRPTGSLAATGSPEKYAALYAREEVVAETAAALVAQRMGIGRTPVENHQAYLSAWLAKMDKHIDHLPTPERIQKKDREDRLAWHAGKALADAHKASQHLLERMPELQKTLKAAIDVEKEQFLEAIAQVERPAHEQTALDMAKEAGLKYPNYVEPGDKNVGRIIGVNENMVVQLVGAGNVTAHDVSELGADPAEIIGKRVEIEYENGKPKSVQPAQRQQRMQDRDRRHERDLTRDRGLDR